MVADAVIPPDFDSSFSLQSSLWTVLFVVLLVLVCFYIFYRVMSAHERKALEEQKAQLLRTNDKDKDAVRLRVLSDVSHELLTPVTLIIGPLQQMASEPLPEELRGKVQMMLRNAQILLHQVNMLPSGTKSGIIPAILSADSVVTPTVSSQAMAVPKQATAVSNQPAASITDEHEGVDDNNAASVKAQSEEGQDEAGNGQNGRFTLLMVDDSPDMCRFVHDYFRGEYNVITANNGEQAVKCLIENEDIDLVVSDVTMPKMDGLELCRHIKTDLRWSHIPVILLTGRKSEEMEVKGLALGADDYITKPFNVEMLRLRVKKFIEKRADRQRQFHENADVLPSDITISPTDADFIQKAIQICEDNISDVDFSVEAMGRELGLSRTYLYKKILNITGKAPGEFIRTIRMKRAKQYLEKTSMQIAEIAIALGYGNPKRFTENFKAEYGMSPSEYLKQKVKKLKD